MLEVVAALIWNGTRFLACQRPAHKARGGMWEFAGGKVEPEETKEEALIRECREELGVTLSVQEPFMTVCQEEAQTTIRLTLFWSSIQEGTPQKLEHQDLRWMTWEESQNYTFCPADTILLHQLQTHLTKG